jgi:4'-phosphopantetheinyl transferase EntD
MGNGDQVWKNPDRSPAWPNGFAGSISHSENWTWASVGRTQEVTSIGVDTEVVVLPETREQVALEIAAESEWQLFRTLDLSPEQIFSVVFSAKEAFYKCCYPIVKQYFGFEHATVVMASADQLRIQPHASHPAMEVMPSALTVHFLATNKDVFTVTWMEPAK